MQKVMFANQNEFEKQTVELIKKDKKSAIEKITKYSFDWQEKVVNRAWNLIDELWTKYDELF